MPGAQALFDKLGLRPDDGEIMMDAHRRSNARIWGTIRPLCMQAVGDAALVDRLGGMACLRIIEQAATASDPMATVKANRHVAEVHARLRPSPEAAQAQDPLFEALMAFTSEAKLFEQDMAESFGPEEAKRISHALPCVATVR